MALELWSPGGGELRLGTEIKLAGSPDLEVANVVPEISGPSRSIFLLEAPVHGLHELQIMILLF